LDEATLIRLSEEAQHPVPSKHTLL